MKRRSNSYFGGRHGRGSTFKCDVCSRLTRDTGNGVTHLCAECWEIAGLDNMVNDNGYEVGSKDYAEARAECDMLLAKAVKKGSDGAKIKVMNGFIWPEG